VDWIYLPKDRESLQSVVHAVMNTQVTQTTENFLTIGHNSRFSRRTGFIYLKIERVCDLLCMR
jgi:uncharacterized protein (DUF1499 family)